MLMTHTKTALVFAGQGAQKTGMGKDWAEQFPEARAWFDRANEALGYDLARICFEGPEDQLAKTEHAQPGIFLVGWIAFELLRKRVPALEWDAAAGLSLGEFTAIAAAGGMTFEDGLRLVRERGRFMQEACESTRGAMAVLLGLDEAQTLDICAVTGAQPANYNCPGQIVISGSVEQIQAACELGKQRGAKKTATLPVAGAYHSPLMASAQVKLRALLEQVSFAPLRVPVISNVTAQPHGTAEEIAARLVDQVTAPVRWEASMRYLLRQGFSRFIELGPGAALSGFMKRMDPNAQRLQVSDAASLEATVAALSPA